MVPVRDVVAAFAAALKLTVPLPVPPGEPVTVNQLFADDAVHEQFAAVDTLNDPAPPLAPTDPLAGEIEYEQGAACVTVNVRPAIVSVPVRAAPEFAATL
jgi:hypothetical protein